MVKPVNPAPIRQATLVAFVRRSLNVKGTTQHGGRGAFDCGVIGASFHLLYEKLTDKLPVWAAEGVVTEFKITPDRIEAVFNADRFGKTYNKLVLDYETFNRRSTYQIKF